MHGLREVVAESRCVSVDPDRRVDVKILAILALIIKDAVVRINPQTGQFDFVTLWLFAHDLTLP
jgi:hypothetical protein